jgi:hypothetical protein
MIYYVGDLHGRVEDMMEIDRKVIKNNIKYVVQVGDFGIRWPGTTCSMWKYFEKRSRKLGPATPTWITCGGNHENWDKWLQLSEKQKHPNLVEIAPGCFYAKRGTVHTLDGIKHLFLGGAESIDKHHRIEGKDWWSYETPSRNEFQFAFDNLEKDKPEVVVTHDAPRFVDIYKKDRFDSPTPRALEGIVNMSQHKPARWYFGHHHVLKNWNILGTEYFCCGSHGEFYTWPLPPQP